VDNHSSCGGGGPQEGSSAWECVWKNLDGLGLFRVEKVVNLLWHLRRRPFVVFEGEHSPWIREKELGHSPGMMKGGDFHTE